MIDLNQMYGMKISKINTHGKTLDTLIEDIFRGTELEEFDESLQYGIDLLGQLVKEEGHDISDKDLLIAAKTYKTLKDLLKLSFKPLKDELEAMRTAHDYKSKQLKK
jgi:predicted nucleotidyltransferase